MSPEARELEEAQMFVADTAAEFVDGEATIYELRKAVADWRTASQALADAVRDRCPNCGASKVDLHTKPDCLRVLR